MKSSSSLKDVAKKAGVGIGTASRALNNKPLVKPETRKLVLDTAKELNYKANSIAQGLKCNYTRTIGVIIPDIANDLYPEVVRGIEDVANHYNYAIFLCNTDQVKKKEINALHMLKSKMVDGIIYVSDSNNNTLQNTFDELGIPIVMISIQNESCLLPSVAIDSENAAFIAVNYLCGLGHKKIAMITENLIDKNSGIPRINGYKKALQENDITPDEDMIYEGGCKFNDGYRSMLEILQGKELPTAVFAASDVLAVGASRAILEQGKRIPEDISIVGFGGSSSAEYFYPPITTIEHPKHDMGKVGADLLKSILANEKPEVINIILNCKLIIRKSCMKI